MFNQQVPKTDKEAINIFSLYEDKILANALIGIFKCYRAKGVALLKAYLDTLEEHIKTKRN